MDINYEDEIKWSDEIKNKLGTTKHMLMFDFMTSTQTQKILLSKIVFEDPNSVTYWSDYIRFIAQKENNFNSIFRLLNFAFTFIEKPENYNEEIFIQLCLFKANFYGEHGKDPRKVFREMDKKKIGSHSAEFYKLWSEVEKKHDEPSAQLIIEKGIKRNAQPIQLLLSLKEKKRKQGVQYDDGEVIIEKKSRRINSTEIEKYIENIPKESKKETLTSTNIGLKVAALTKSTLNQNGIENKLMASKLGRPTRIQQENIEYDLLIPEEKDNLKQITNINRLSNISESSGNSRQSESSSGSNQTVPETNQSTVVTLKKKYIDDRLANFNPSSRFSKDKVTTSIIKQEKNQEQNQEKNQNKDKIIEIKEGKVKIDLIPTKIIDNKKNNDKKDDNNYNTINSNESMTNQQETRLEDDCMTVKEKPIVEAIISSEVNQNQNQLLTKRNLMNENLNLISNPSNKYVEDNEINLSKTLKIVKREPKISPNIINLFQEIYVNNNAYLKLDGVLGKGASSSVCRIISVSPLLNNSNNIEKDTKNKDNNYENININTNTNVNVNTDVQIYAYKRIDIRQTLPEDTEEILASYANEINLLKQCRGSPYIINLIDYEVNRKNLYVSMVLELGEVDLATAINYYKKNSTSTSTTIDQSIISSKVNPFFMRMVWERMLLAVDYIHEQRIVHGDLKPANFVFVRGQLKLIDFGISKEISNDTTNIVRNGLIGTINYMAPEAVMPHTIPIDEMNSEDDEDEINNNNSRNNNNSNSSSKKKQKHHHIIKHGRASDVWSLGCILYQMLYGKTPFATIRNLQQKVALITNLNAEIQYPIITEYLGIDVAKKCLVREVSRRATIRGENGLLNHPFLTSHSNKTCNASTNTELQDILSFVSSTSNVSTSTSPLPLCNSTSKTKSKSPKVSIPIKLNDLESTSLPTTTTTTREITRVETRKLVESILNHIEEKKEEKLEKEELCEEIYHLLNSKLDEISKKSTNEMFLSNDGVLPASLFKQTRKPLRKISQQLSNNNDNINNNKDNFNTPSKNKSNSNGNNNNKNSLKKMLNTGKSVNVQDLKTAKLNLRESATSSSSKWMRPKGTTPPKGDLQSVLQKQLGDMRKFLAHEDDMTYDPQDEFSFQEF